MYIKDIFVLLIISCVIEGGIGFLCYFYRDEAWSKKTLKFSLITWGSLIVLSAVLGISFDIFKKPVVILSLNDREYYYDLVELPYGEETRFYLQDGAEIEFVVINGYKYYDVEAIKTDLSSCKILYDSKRPYAVTYTEKRTLENSWFIFRSDSYQDTYITYEIHLPTWMAEH